MQTLVVTSNNSQKIKVIKQLLKALDMPFKSKNASDYNPEFVKKLEIGLLQIKKKQTAKIDLDEIWK
jgi:inosine/xanthosine triphosphate pyrophosphatase family protein